MSSGRRCSHKTGGTLHARARPRRSNSVLILLRRTGSGPIAVRVRFSSDLTRAAVACRPAGARAPTSLRPPVECDDPVRAHLQHRCVRAGADPPFIALLRGLHDIVGGITSPQNGHLGWSFIHSFILFFIKKLTNATYDKIYKVCSRLDKLENSLKYV